MSLLYVRADGFRFRSGFAEHSECLTGSTLENRPLGMTSGENAQPHHCGQQQPGVIVSGVVLSSTLAIQAA